MYKFLPLFVFLISCTQLSSTVKEPETVQYVGDKYIHYVKYKGETLSSIAAWYTGDFKNWRKLAEASNFKNPNKIEIGQTVFIPKSILKKSEAFPQTAIVKKAEPVVVKRASLKRTKVNFEDKLKKLESEKSLSSDTKNSNLEKTGVKKD